jgi:hypothetical protein
VHDGDLDPASGGDGMGIVVEGVHDMEQARLGLTQLAPSAARGAYHAPAGTESEATHDESVCRTSRGMLHVVVDADEGPPENLGRGVHGTSGPEHALVEVVCRDSGDAVQKSELVPASAECSPVLSPSNGAAALPAPDPGIAVAEGRMEAPLELSETSSGTGRGSSIGSLQEAGTLQGTALDDATGGHPTGSVSDEQGETPANDHGQVQRLSFVICCLVWMYFTEVGQAAFLGMLTFTDVEILCELGHIVTFQNAPLKRVCICSPRFGLR